MKHPTVEADLKALQTREEFKDDWFGPSRIQRVMRFGYNRSLLLLEIACGRGILERSPNSEFLFRLVEVEKLKMTESQPIHKIFAQKILNKKDFLASNPTHVGTVADIRFYECPVRGDESPLIAIKGEHCVLTSDFDMPCADEML